MITKHHSYKYLLISCLVVIAIGVSACATATSPPGPTNSESASGIAELEAQIRQLETENRELKADNQQLSRDLTQTTAQLRNIHNLVTSSSYRNTISKLIEIQSESSDLATFAYGLPDLPRLPPGLTVSQINDAIDDSRELRELLEDLPKLPPPGWPPFIPFPEPLIKLDEMKNIFVDMTDWMEDLEDLPEFLAKAESLEDLKSHIESYLGDVENTASEASGMLEQVRDAAS